VRPCPDARRICSIASARITQADITFFTDDIVYNQSTGELFYDADGAGGAAAVKFAVLANHASLSAASFQIL
jgi:Ca2+-binding RTX toxin-like protein